MTTSSDIDKRYEDISNKANDLIFRIQNITKQLDICVIRVGQLEQRLDSRKKITKVLWTRRNDDE